MTNQKSDSYKELGYNSKSQMRRVEHCKENKDKAAYCNYCRKTTKTIDWDCTECGFSKPFPEGLDNK